MDLCDGCNVKEVGDRWVCVCVLEFFVLRHCNALIGHGVDKAQRINNLHLYVNCCVDAVGDVVIALFDSCGFIIAMH